jgi:type 2 lantibiotic biosynthesis protein LanM
VARASTPWERLEGRGFRASSRQDDAAVEARIRAWAQAVTGGDRAALLHLLGERGVAEAGLRAAVADVEVADEAALPGWAADVRRLLETPPPAEPLAPFRLDEVLNAEELAANGGDAGAAWRLDPVVAPFVAAEARWLSDARAGCGLPVSAAVPRRLLARLARVVSDVAVHALIHRIDAADVAAGTGGQAGTTRLDAFHDGADVLATWGMIFSELPVLARAIAVARRHWRESTGELLDRLKADLPLLQDAFGAGASLGSLERCEPGAGDPHDGGRAVVMLTFGGGQRVVYKPRDLRVAGVYGGFARVLNAAGLRPPLHERTVLERGGHAWEEFVHGEGCADESAVRRYYRRMGMHARLLQLTGGLDFTCDNVVAVGEHPVLIDLEMLTAPLLSPPTAGSAAEERAAGEAARLPTRSGIVTARIYGEPGRRPAELGALGAGGTRQAPFRQPTPRRGEDGQVRTVEEYPFFPTGAAAPRLGGQPVPAAGYLHEVEEGYLEMSRRLRKCAAELGAPGGPLAALAEAPVRFLARDTQIYMRMLLESLRPARLRDGVQREICLERLWKAKFSDPGVVRQEVESLRVLDVPLFTSRPGTDALDLHDAPPAAGFFQGSAMHAIRARLSELETSTDADERDAIRGALAIVAPEHVVPLPTHPTDSADPQSTDGFLDAAVQVSSQILDLAFDAGDGPAWTGLHYAPQHDAWHAGLLPDDTLTGACGLAMLFGDLHRLGAPERFGQAARALLGRFAARIEGFREATPPAPGAPFCGGMVGWGSWLHAVARGSRALGDAEILRRAVDGFAALPLEQAGNAPTDVVGGRAGLLMALLSAGVGTDGPLAGFAGGLVERLVSALSAKWEPGQGAYPAGARMLSLAPGGRDGVALALARAASAGLTSPAHVEAWIASAPPADRSGAHLARLAIARPCPSTGRASVDAARAFASGAVSSDATPELLEAAEVALAVYTTGGDADDLERAREIGGWIVARRRTYGSWFPDRLAPDRLNLSAVSGLGALAHLFTRLHAPGGIGSIRVME